MTEMFQITHSLRLLSSRTMPSTIERVGDLHDFVAIHRICVSEVQVEKGISVFPKQYPSRGRSEKCSLCSNRQHYVVL